MAHTQSYSVTKPEKLPEQPHLKSTEDVKSITLTGWCGFATAGGIALTILLCISLLGGDRVFPRRLCVYQGFVPIPKEGYFDVIPFSPGISTGVKRLFNVELPLKNITQTTETIQDILNGYPPSASHLYRHCWLENPSQEQPCYFDPRWITEFCSNEDDFGYKEINGSYSPCFLLTIVNTTNWIPVPVTKNAISGVLQENYDPGFVPIGCKTFKNGRQVWNETELFPPKGISQLYFPISKFNSERYLPPLVAVKIHNIEKGQNVTIECALLAQNSFMLWDNGAFSLSIRSTL